MICCVESYRAALLRFDWTYEYSDDQRVWIRGNCDLAELRLAQPEIDPSGSIWLEMAPRISGVPIPIVTKKD